MDPDGRPVPGATVILVGERPIARQRDRPAAGASSRSTSPDTGRFRSASALAGFRGELRASRPARSAQDCRRNPARRSSAVAESVVVSASQVEIPLSQASSTVTIITGAELEARQVHSVADALRTVPGLTVAATGGPGAVTGVFPRGGESNFTLVFVDDVPVNAVRWRVRFRAPVDRERRADRDRPRAAERALRFQRDRRRRPRGHAAGRARRRLRQRRRRGYGTSRLTGATSG